MVLLASVKSVLIRMLATMAEVCFYIGSGRVDLKTGAIVKPWVLRRDQSRLQPASQYGWHLKATSDTFSVRLIVK